VYANPRQDEQLVNEPGWSLASNGPAGPASYPVVRTKAAAGRRGAGETAQ